MATRAKTQNVRRGKRTPQPRPQPKRRKLVSPRRARLIDRVLRALRITPAMVRQATTIAICMLVCAGLLALAAVAGIPRRVGGVVAQQLARAGFEVRNVEISGLSHMDRMTVYGIVLDQHAHAMASLDLEDVRHKLMAYSWVADAHVSRRLPDTLVVDITERKPAAIWQHNGALTMVDGQGVVLQDVTATTMPGDLPLIIGPAANTRAAALSALLAEAPRLRTLVTSATWIGNRRWDLGFNTGETLALPEGDAQAADALRAFAAKDAAHPLLGHGYARFDTRDGTHLLIKFATKDQPDDTPPVKPAAAPSRKAGDG